MMVNGKLARCMVMEYKLSKMEISMMDTLLRINVKVLGSIFGKMGEFMMESGKMGSNMVKDFISNMERKGMENGKMVKELDGLNDYLCLIILHK